MVRLASAPLTKIGFRRDVKLFLSFLVGFLILLIFSLVFVLRASVAQSEAMIDRSERIVAEVAVAAVNGASPAALDTELVSLRGRFHVAAMELQTRDGRRLVSGETHGSFDDVQRLTGPGTLTLHFDAAGRQALHSRFTLTAGICVTAASLGIALLLLYVPRILRPIEAMLDQAKELGERGDQEETAYLIETFRNSIATLRSQEAELKRLHAIEKSALETRVQEMQTLAQLGEISAGIAHELRNSVNTILGYMKLARRSGVDDAAGARLQSAEKEAGLLLQAIERLLAFARPLHLNTEPVDLRELADAQVRQLGDLGEGEVSLDVQGPPVVIDADRVLLSRAIENLLLNAVDAVREKGRGAVRVAVTPDPPSLTITDDGAGFDPAETQRLFLPFHSNKPSGFGMGLPLARKIVLLHGGTLRLTGEPGKGAEATMVFAGEPAGEG